MRKTLAAASVGLVALVAPLAPSQAANWIIDSKDVIDFGLGTGSVGPIDISTLAGNTDGPSVTITPPGSLNITTKAIPNLDRSELLETDSGTINKVIGTSAAPTGEVNNEGLRFDFDETVFLTQLTVAHLYPAGEHDDANGEVGVFEITRANNTVDTFFLRPDSETTASLYSSLSFSVADLVPLVTVVNLQEAIDGKNDTTDGPNDVVIEKASQQGPGNQGGVWQILGDNIFGDFVSLVIRGLDQDNINGNTPDSDFSFVAAGGATAVVPLPAALPFLLTGLAGLALVSRRRKSGNAV